MTQYWVMATVISKIFVSLDGSTAAEFHQDRPTIGAPGGVPAITMREMDGSGDWADTWLIAADPVRGVIEYGDTFPNGNKFVYAAGLEIQWAKPSMNVGDSVSAQWHLDPTKSIGVANDGTSWGWNQATLTAIIPSMTVPAGTFTNVVQIDWVQSICGNATCSFQNTLAGTYWLAPGVGMIKMQWTQPNAGGPFVLGAVTETPQ